MVASGVSEVKTPGVKSPFTSEKREAGAALLSEGPEGSAFPLHAVQAGLGEEGPQKDWEDFLTRQCEYPVENQIIKLLLMLFPLPGKLLTIHPHLPKLDLSPRYHLETLSFEIHNVKGRDSLHWITLISLVSLLFPIRQQIP